MAKTIPSSTVVPLPAAPAAVPMVISDDPVNRGASTEAMKLRLQKLGLSDEVLALCELADGGLAGGSLLACAAVLAAAGKVGPAVGVLAQGLSGRGAAWWACRVWMAMMPPTTPRRCIKNLSLVDGMRSVCGSPVTGSSALSTTIR